MFKGTLYPYQEKATTQFIDRQSILLAFSPGTGKTVIAIAAAEQLMDDFFSFCLVICPASLKYQWEARIKQFTDTNVLVIDGDKEARRKQYAYHDTRFLGASDAVGYLIVSYDAVLHDYEEISSLRPDMVVCDEISAIKSFRAIRSKRIKKLFSKVPYRLGMTATPIENKPEELYSIMQFVDSTVLGRYDLFEKAYISRNRNGWVEAYKNLDVLRLRIGDAMLRKTRLDPDVRPYLPEVYESDIEVLMPLPVKHAYKVIAEDMLVEMASAVGFGFEPPNLSTVIDESTPPGRLMAMHMCMEMLLDHPDLIYWSASEYEKDSPFGSAYAHDLKQRPGIIYSTKNTEPQKIEKLKDELAYILSDPSSKVIVFSKYKKMLSILQDTLTNHNHNWKSVIYHGELSAKERNSVVEKFANDPSIRIFLSSYAGGYGLDMNMCDYLINYDLPWSFGAQDQLNSRHVRASSLFEKVYVINLVTKGTIEERKMRILKRKRKMSELAIDGMQYDDATVALDDDFLGTHLRKVTGRA